MGKHRLGQTEGRQWGGPDLVNGAEDALGRSDGEQSEQSAAERAEDD
ncbi:hypothetical protein IOD16_15630 [Saccharothrix sp. 6-C]|uniref:Uncharacterized protein n=1 Tax=Saccharothrix texasensis TaxID=103734 RepID=A0A3N1GZ55_9PSEU|nr:MULTISPECIES: hypothetical protein [Saccharothrix]QQQ79697.1 hypothetical protein IOD16_15630 [Saccharothrix sp. 6-C]ROP35252.1 hypothetical protein EDD40_0474 [Saccharothrix texasensis]